MKTIVKVGLAMLAFGLVLAVVGVVFIRAHASKPEATLPKVAVTAATNFASHKM